MKKKSQNLHNEEIPPSYRIGYFMEMDRKALYNSLFMHWRDNPDFAEVEKWQIEDYRSIPLESLFQRLEKFDISLDKNRFLAYAREVDSPEELFETVVNEEEIDEKSQDQIYLLLFELYRRLLPESRPLSIFCDELDHLIDEYDRSLLKSNESLEYALASLEQILEENLEENFEDNQKSFDLNGKANPSEIFVIISSCCANDIESFLVDFISEEIDAKNYTYASELLEDFEKYVLDKKWFVYLEAKLASETNRDDSEILNQKLLTDASVSNDLDFALEALAFFSKNGEENTFPILAVKKLPWLKTEQDFKDFLSIAADYYRFLDREEDEKQLLEIIDGRNSVPQDAPFDPKNEDVDKLIAILKGS